MAPVGHPSTAPESLLPGLSARATNMALPRLEEWAVRRLRVWRTGRKDCLPKWPISKGVDEAKFAGWALRAPPAALLVLVTIVIPFVWLDPCYSWPVTCTHVCLAGASMPLLEKPPKTEPAAAWDANSHPQPHYPIAPHRLLPGGATP